jgi:hypothetical protein
MKVPKTFVPENNERLEEKAKNYLNKVEYVQKPYDEEELGLGATATLPEEMSNADLIWGFTPYDKAKPSKSEGLSVEELEKKILEDYTVVQ